MEVVYNEKFASISDKELYFLSNYKDEILNFINKYKHNK